MDSSKKYVNPSPERNACLVNRLFFCWVLPFFKYGYKNDVQLSDIYNATNEDVSKPLGNNLERNWLKEIARASKEEEKPSLKRAIFKTFYKSYGFYGIFLFVQVIIIKSLQPVILAAYIRFFDTSGQRGIFAGWILGISTVALSFLGVLIQHQCGLGCLRIGMRVRVACCSLLYRKLLRLSQGSLGKTAAGQVVNLLSNDVDRFDSAALFLHYLWLMPLQVIAALYLMFDSVGMATVVGMTVVTLQAIFLQGCLSRLQGKLRYKIALKTDHRIKLMSEIVSGIQVIKMYAWEKPFEKVVEIARKLELFYITRVSYIKGISSALAVVTERLTLYLTVITYALMGNNITGDVVFSLAQLFNIVQLYMCIFFPTALSLYAESKVSIKRLEEFLLLEENEAIVTAPSADIPTEEGLGSIRLTEVNASWSLSSPKDTLRNINLTINPGTLCCVVGSVGAGKTSLLQLLLKEMYIKSGKLEIDGTVSYASQEPWLFASSVRDNILFGRQYIKNRYKNVIKVCALEKDLEQFSLGDKTLVGERGVSLSGGQKARVNLARAVYAEADIYLLDDPLSAVDTHVGKSLFEGCIEQYLEGKTRILVTHQLQFLQKADIIVVIVDGKIDSVGTYEELATSALNKIDLPKLQENVKDKLEDKEDKMKIERLQSISSVGSSVGKEEDEPQENTELIAKGTIPLSTYKEYWQAGASSIRLIGLLVLMVGAQIACNICDLWLTRWTNSAEEVISHNMTVTSDNIQDSANPLPTGIQSHSKGFYIIIYTIFMITASILTVWRSFVFYKICMTASRILHNKMFANILRSPMRFFDITPSGRILNRFSKDMGSIDEILPTAMLNVIAVFLLMSGIFAMIFIVTPWMMVPAAVVLCLFYTFRDVYLKSAQDVRRFEAVNRAPIFTHVVASFHGLPTIRSSDAQEMVADEFDDLQDQHTGALYMFLACSQTFGFYLDVISSVFLAFVTLQFLIFRSDNIVGGNVGLAISSCLTLTGMVQMGVRQSAEVANHMTSVERVLEYTKLQKEQFGVSRKEDKDWPSDGKITFVNTSVRYVLGEAPVLRNLNIIIQPAEKIGVVGRTGAGKSTLIASLFRLAPIEGIIAIDDVDISKVGLEDLRSKISIIPQDPFIFSSTVRYNLDPFMNYTDDILWNALDSVELKTAISSLDQIVSEGGSNFSAGQRQLLCLARAIVRNNKILVMDEATANVDQRTDSIIQKTIRENFKDCTVVTIAHRLNTIMDYDKVLVLDFGEAVEFAHAHELLQNPDGHFTKMVQETGSDMERTLRVIAMEAYEEKFSESLKADLKSAMEEGDTSPDTESDQ